MRVSPGELMDRVAHGDPEAHFAFRAAQEEFNRKTERWRQLFKAMKKIWG